MNQTENQAENWFWGAMLGLLEKGIVLGGQGGRPSAAGGGVLRPVRTQSTEQRVLRAFELSPQIDFTVQIWLHATFSFGDIWNPWCMKECLRYEGLEKN